MPIAIDPMNPQIMYAGSYGSGVYKSVDGGVTWALSSQGLTNLFIYSLAIDPIHPSTVYAGTYRSQVFKSTDGGNTWNWSGSGMQDSAIVYSIAVDPSNSNIVFASTRGTSNAGNAPWNGVVYKSTNYGATWVTSLSNLGGPELQDWAYSVLVNPHNDNEVLIAAHETGPHQYLNSRDSWLPIYTGITDLSGRAIVVGLQDAFASTYYYGTWHKDSIYKSTNSGGTWNPIGQAISYYHIYNISLDPSDGNNIYLATFNGVIKSDDGGSNWHNPVLSFDDIYSVVLKPNSPSTMLAGTAGDGVYRSSDSGANWVHSSTGIENSTVTSVIASPASTSIIYSSLNGGGVFRSSDRGQNWSEFNQGLLDRYVLNLVMDPSHPNLLYALTTTGGLFKNDLNSSNGWIATGNGLPLTSLEKPAYQHDSPFATLEMRESFVNQNTTNASGILSNVSLLSMAFASPPSSIVYLGTSGSGIYKSTDGGQSWLPTGLTTGNINSLAVDVTNPNLVYAATDSYGGFYVTQDGGNIWSNVSLGVTFYSLAVSPTVSGMAYAGTSNGVYQYQSGGFSSLGLDGKNITAIQLNPSRPGLIYAGSDQAAYYNLNMGQGWQVVDDRLNGKTVSAISLDPLDSNQVYFSTTTHGIFYWLSP